MIHRFTVAPGALLLVIGVNALAIGALYDQGAYPILPTLAIVLAGITADVLLQILKPSVERVTTLRFFGVLFPMLFIGFYLGASEFTSGV